AFVDLFVHLDGHDELELLGRHFAFLGGLAVVGTTSSRAPATLKAGVTALRGGSSLRAGIARLFGGLLPPIEPRPAVDHALAAVFPRFPSFCFRRRRSIFVQVHT